MRRWRSRGKSCLPNRYANSSGSSSPGTGSSQAKIASTRGGRSGRKQANRRFDHPPLFYGFDVRAEPPEVRGKLTRLSGRHGSQGMSVQAKRSIGKLRLSPARHKFLNHDLVRGHERAGLVVPGQEGVPVIHPPCLGSGERILRLADRRLDDDGKGAIQFRDFVAVARANRGRLVNVKALRQLVEEPLDRKSVV